MNWQALGAKLAQSLGLEAGPVDARPMHGGNINQAFRLELGGGRFFVKLNRADLLAMFEAERVGLDAIRASAAIRAPRVLMTGCEGGHAYIVMEYIELGGRPVTDRLARSLAAMHGCRRDRFGFERDNTIGSTPQINAWHDDWVEFWRCNRLLYQLRLAEENGFDSALIDAGNRLAESLGDFFAGYMPCASLLHGDLWSGNQGVDAEGYPVIYDPACYYGDHEADLAMMELFGHPGERFFAVYHEHFPIDDGYPLRRDLYNLYHLLNHANLFGGSYAAQSQRLIDHLLAQHH